MQVDIWQVSVPNSKNHKTLVQTRYIYLHVAILLKFGKGNQLLEFQVTFTIIICNKPKVSNGSPKWGHIHDQLAIGCQLKFILGHARCT